MNELSTRRLLVGVLSLSSMALLPAPAAQAGPPISQALNDGCQRNPAGLLSYTSPEWVWVNSPATGDNLRLIEGTTTLTHTADEDLPEGHLSYDLDSDVVPDPQYQGLLGGDPNMGTGNFAPGADQGKVHVEWESGSVPAYVWPTEGDRIKLWGQWIWDCGHWGQGIETDQSNPQGSLIGTGDYFLPGQIEGPAPSGLRGEQTELHPMQAMVVTRAAPWQPTTSATETDVYISNDGTHAYGEEQCARSSVHQNPTVPTYGPDFSACVNNSANWVENIAGHTYDFFVPAPPKPSATAQLTLREVPQVCSTPPLSTGSCQNNGFSEQLTPAANGVNVRVTADQIPAGDTNLHAFGASYFVGWSPPGPAPTHLQLTVKTITIRHALAEPNQGHPTVAGVPAVGRYNLYIDSNGRWDFIGGRAPEPNDPSWAPGLGMVQDGQSFTVNHNVDFFVPPGAPVRLEISGRECDLPRMDPCLVTPEVADSNDHPGQTIVTFPSAAASIGDHTLASPIGPDQNPTTTDPNYVITYSIQQVGGVGNGPSPPGSTGVPSSSPGGNLSGAGQVLNTAASSGGLSRCAAAGSPRSRIQRVRRLRGRHPRLRGSATPSGCASVARVQVAVARRAGHRCRFLTRRGRLGPRRSCSRPSYLSARGGARWTLRLRRHLPRGRYVATSRATDTAGRVELTRARGNMVRFRIR